jgi:hypothetical protein
MDDPHEIFPLKPPLSFDDLAQIKKRNPGNSDVGALLWEIKRLHEAMRRADLVVRTFGTDFAYSHGMVMRDLKRFIEDHPIIVADAEWRDFLINGWKDHPKPEDDVFMD